MKNGMRVSPYYRNEEEDYWPATGIPHTGGFSDSHETEIELTEKEWRKLKKDRRKALKHKHPIGFQGR